MSSRQLSNIKKVSDDIRWRQTIPSSYRAALEERLVIVCTPLTRQSRGKVRRCLRNNRSRHNRKKAQTVYAQILEEAPDVFLPFLLVISPRACENFDVPKFCQNYGKQELVPLKNDAEAIFGAIASTHGINESSEYKRLIGLLFPKAFSTRPITIAESGQHWAYHAADINAIRTVFGDYICRFVESASIRLREKTKNPTLQTTECVRMSLPRSNFQDAIIRLDIGPARGLAKTLFPRAVLPLSDEPEDGCTQVLLEQQGISISEFEVDHAYFTLKGASALAFATVFTPRICEALEASDLRLWEKEHFLLDTSDCVTLELCRKEPHYGTVFLRTGFIASVQIASDLYADVGML